MYEITFITIQPSLDNIFPLDFQKLLYVNFWQKLPLWGQPFFSFIPYVVAEKKAPTEHSHITSQTNDTCLPWYKQSQDSYSEPSFWSKLHNPVTLQVFPWLLRDRRHRTSRMAGVLLRWLQKQLSCFSHEGFQFKQDSVSSHNPMYMAINLMWEGKKVPSRTQKLMASKVENQDLKLSSLLSFHLIFIWCYSEKLGAA